MSNRIQHKVTTTRDAVVDHTWTVGISGSATALSATLLHGTELHALVSGTSPGRVFLALPKDNSYFEMMGWHVDMHAGSTSSLDFGGRNQLSKEHYIVQPLGYIAPYGNPLASSSVGVYANPGTQTNPNAIDYNGRSYFTVEISKLQMTTGALAGVAPVSATLADPIDASVASGWPVAKVVISARFRDRSRT